MMIELANKARCSEPTIYPQNWDGRKVKGMAPATTDFDWYIHYRYYNADHPKGKLIIVKKGINYYKDIKARRIAIKTQLAETKELLVKEQLNPIAKTRLEPDDPTFEIDPQLGLCKALTKALARIKVEDNTRRDIKNILPHVKKAASQIHLDEIPVSQVKRRHVIKIFDQLKVNKHRWSANLHNHYRKYLSMLFNEMVVLEAMETNPIDKYFKKESQVKKMRVLLTTDQREKIRQRLSTKRMSAFWRYLNIFYHLGGRITELQKLKGKDVDLKNQYIKVVIMKGGKPREAPKIIKDIALPFWNEVMQECKPDDYVFSKGLKPGEKKIRPDQITKRWTRLIKPLGIESTFYALKHANSDEIAALLGLNAAGQLNSHTNTSTTRIYAVNEREREAERLKKVNNKFA